MDARNMDWLKFDYATLRISQSARLRRKNCFVQLKNFTSSHRKMDKFSLWMLSILIHFARKFMNFTVKLNLPNLAEDLH